MHPVMWHFITKLFAFLITAGNVDTAPFTVEIVSWGHLNPLSLAAIVYNGPPIETAIEDMNARYNGSIFARHTVLWNRDIVANDDIVAQIDAVMADWYYRKRRDVDMSVLIAAGNVCKSSPSNYIASDAAMLPGSVEQHNVNRLAAAWNLLMLTSVASDAIQINKVLTPTWVSLSPQTIFGYATFLKNLFIHYNWTTIYILVETTVNQGYIQVYKNLFAMLDNISNTQVFERTVRAENASVYNNVLDEFRRNSRIMMFFGHARQLRSLLIAAYKANMTSDEYVYVAIGQIFPFRIFGNYTWAYSDGEDDAARHAYKNLLLVEMFDAMVRYPSDDLRDRWIAQTQQKYNYSMEWKETFIAASYALVEIFFQILNDTITTFPDFDVNNGKLFATRFFNRSFQSKFIRLAVDEFGHPRTVYLVKSMDPSTSQMGVVMYGDRVPVLNGTIYWAGKEHATPPLNEPVCGYLGNKGPCQRQEQTGKVVGIACAVVFVICCVVIAAVYRRIRLDSQNDSDDFWLIQYEQLRPVQHPATSEMVVCEKCEYAAIFQPTQDTVWICPSARFANGDVTRPSNPTRTTARLINELRHINSDNVNLLLGLSSNPDQKSLLFVAPFCARGSLDHFCKMQNHLNVDIQNSLAIDLVRGLHFIHTKTSLGVHGNLTRWACLVDRHFTLKIGHFGYSSLTEQLCGQNAIEEDDAAKLFWTAPELLRNTVEKPNKATDIYSTGILLYEIYTLCLPYATTIQMEATASQVIEAIRNGRLPYLRPLLESSPKQLAVAAETLEKCWSEQPNCRPDVADLLKEVIRKTGSSFQQRSFVDSLLHRLQKYAETLEDEIRNRTAELQLEQKRCDELLREMLPHSVVQRLRNGEKVLPEYFDCVTVLFCNIWGFEIQVVSLRSPVEVTGFLNTLYSAFDPIVKGFDAYKVETVGSSYMVVSGLPERNDDKHVTQIVLLSLSLMKSFATSAKMNGLHFIAGIHTGPCVAGVVGLRNPRYCLFGDTINTASRMQSYSLPGQIQLSVDTAEMLHKNDDGSCSFEIRERGKVDIKGKGVQTTFWLQEIMRTN